MYSACIFCHADLGKNESIEHFPIGRRLAFDAARGRLWVICRQCERWNLTPLEERWEAIEECERLFSGTKLRVSTEHVGLAKLRSGITLIRIGQPQRPELAAWRYGDQFGRRYRRTWAYTGVMAVVMGGVIVAGLTGALVGGASMFNLVSLSRSAYERRRVRTRLSVPGQPDPVLLRNENLKTAYVDQHEDGWALNFTYATKRRGPMLESSMRSFRLSPREVMLAGRITGEPAIQAIAKVLPAINSAGAGRRAVESAIDLVEATPRRDDLLREWVYPRMDRGSRLEPMAPVPFSDLPKPVLLAFEMAAHEETERRALEGELSILEEMWRDAEEVAAIADDLLVPDDTRAKLTSLKDEER